MKIVISDELYFSPGGCGSGSLNKAPFCAIGKIREAIRFSERGYFYPKFRELINPIQCNDRRAEDIYSINDYGAVGGTAKPENHYKALHLAIQYLQEAGHEVEFENQLTFQHFKEAINV